MVLSDTNTIIGHPEETVTFFLAETTNLAAFMRPIDSPIAQLINLVTSVFHYWRLSER